MNVTPLSGLRPTLKPSAVTSVDHCRIPAMGNRIIVDRSNDSNNRTKTFADVFEKYCEKIFNFFADGRGNDKQQLARFFQEQEDPIATLCKRTELRFRDDVHPYVIKAFMQAEVACKLAGEVEELCTKNPTNAYLQTCSKQAKEIAATAVHSANKTIKSFDKKKLAEVYAERHANIAATNAQEIAEIVKRAHKSAATGLFIADAVNYVSVLDRPEYEEPGAVVARAEIINSPPMAFAQVITDQNTDTIVKSLPVAVADVLTDHPIPQNTDTATAISSKKSTTTRVVHKLEKWFFPKRHKSRKVGELKP